MSDDDRLLSTSSFIVDESCLDLTEDLSTMSEEELGYTVFEDPDLAVDMNQLECSSMDMDQFKSPLVDKDPVECELTDMDPLESPLVDMDPFKSPSVDMDPVKCASTDMDPLECPSDPSVDTDSLADGDSDTIGYITIVESESENVNLCTEICGNDIIKIEPSILSVQEAELNNLVTFLVESSESENEETILSNNDNFPKDIVDLKPIQSTDLEENYYDVSNNNSLCSTQDEIMVLDSELEKKTVVELTDDSESMEGANYVLINNPRNDSNILESIETVVNMCYSDLNMPKVSNSRRIRSHTDISNEIPYKKQKIIPKTKANSSKSSLTSKTKIASKLKNKKILIKRNIPTLRSNLKKANPNYAHIYKCLFCRRYFPNPVLLYNHVKTFHKHDDIIPESINSIDEIREIVNKKLSCCPECNCKYFTRISTVHHIRKIHQKRNNFNILSKIYEKYQLMMKCKLCAKLSVDKYLNDYDHFEKHLKQFHYIELSEKTKIITVFLCPQCNITCNEKRSLEQHCKRSHNDLNYNATNCNRKTVEVTKCDYCFKYFKKECNLRKHIRLRHKTNVVVSKQKSSKLLSNRRISDLKDSKKKLSERNKRKIPCYKCDMFFNCQIILKNHLFWEHTVKELAQSNKIKNVTKEPTFLCEICSEMFCYKILLENHVLNNHFSEKQNTTNQNSETQISNVVNIKNTTSKSKENLFSNDLQCNKSTIGYEHSYTKIENDTQIETEVSVKKTYSKSIDTKEFSCIYCDKKLSSKKNMERHISQIHLHADIPLNCIKENKKGKSLYECLKCNISFTNKNAFRKHNFDTHQKNITFKYHCKKCDTIFRNNYEFERHRTVAHNEFKCKTCNSLFEASEYDNHHKIHITEDENINRENNHCKYFHSSQVEIIKKSGLNYNVSYGNKCTNSKPTLLYTCNICEEKYSTLDDFKIHFESVHKLNYIKILSNEYFKASAKSDTCYRCKNCDFMCDTPKLMYVHGLTSTHFFLNDCTICGTLFVHTTELIKHCKEIHKLHNSEKVLKCKICNVGYSKDALRLHVRKKHDKKMIYCCHCKESIDYQRYINRHKKLANLNKQCPMCIKTFPNVNSMIDHVKNHTSDNPQYYCNICVNYFYTKHNLYLHKKMCNKKSVTCDFCSRQYKFKSSLKSHIYNCHLGGKKPLTSTICPFCNKNICRLKLHILSVHSNLFHKDVKY